MIGRSAAFPEIERVPYRRSYIVFCVLFTATDISFPNARFEAIADEKGAARTVCVFSVDPPRFVAMVSDCRQREYPPRFPCDARP